MFNNNFCNSFLAARFARSVVRDVLRAPLGRRVCKNVLLQVVVLPVGYGDVILFANKHLQLLVGGIVLTLDSLFVVDNIFVLVLNFGIFVPIAVDFVGVLRAVVVHIVVAMVLHCQMDFLTGVVL